MNARSEQHTHNIAKSHYVQLDGLRGVAILLVMIYHFCLNHPSFQSDAAGLWLGLAQAGWMGVDLFFVLSGFLITGILIETRDDTHYFRNFIARRTLRIWPLYYLSLLVLLVAIPLLAPSVPAELRSMQDKQVWFWLYVANWLFAKEGGFEYTSGGYFWSLAVEEQFYLLWPLIVYSLSNMTLLRTSALLLVASLLLRVVLGAQGVDTNSLYTMTFTHLDGLAIGAILAIAWRDPPRLAPIARYMPFAAIAALLGLCAIRVVDGDLFFWSKHMAVYGYTLIAILGGSLLLYAVQAGPDAPVNRFFTSRFMTQCGKYSYALYLIHVPVTSVVFAVVRRLAPLPDAATLLVGSGLSFGVSWLLAVASWLLFEKRILALKRHFAYG